MQFKRQILDHYLPNPRNIRSQYGIFKIKISSRKLVDSTPSNNQIRKQMT